MRPEVSVMRGIHKYSNCFEDLIIEYRVKWLSLRTEKKLILSLNDTDVDKDNQASPSIRQSTNSFTINELISVLERISSSMIKPEAALGKAILLNTRGKELFTALDCFVSSFVD